MRLAFFFWRVSRKTIEKTLPSVESVGVNESVEL